MNRTALGAGVVVALALGLVLVLLNRGNEDPIVTTTTTAVVAPSTTTTAAPATTTTSPRSTTTTTVASTTTSDLTAREAEIEALVTELDLALFDATFAGDLAALADVVGGFELYQAASDIAADPSSVFTDAPSAERLSISLASVKLERDDCLVVDVDEDTTTFTTDEAPRQSIFVLWPVDDAELGWRIANRHASGTPESVWIAGCDLLDRSWRP